MSFKISLTQFYQWKNRSWIAPPNSNFDIHGQRFGQQFINDHFDQGLIWSDPEVFYTEDFHEVKKMIMEKYINADE